MFFKNSHTTFFNPVTARKAKSLYPFPEEVVEAKKDQVTCLGLYNIYVVKQE